MYIKYVYNASANWLDNKYNFWFKTRSALNHVIMNNAYNIMIILLQETVQIA